MYNYNTVDILYMEGDIYMFCNKCGKEVPNNSAFCPHCGAKIETLEKTVIDTGVEPTTFTPARKKAIITTILCGIYGLLYLLILLLFGMGIHVIAMTFGFLVMFIINGNAYKGIEIGQKELNAFK